MMSKRKQRGFASLDAMVGLIVLTIVLSLAGGYAIDAAKKQDYRIAAEQQRTMSEAFSKYLKDNYAVVLASAGPTSPVQVTVAMLQNTNYLPAGFSSTNSFGQTLIGLARKPNPNQLEAIVITTGGQAIPELGIRAIAEHLGGPGGFISKLQAGVIEGVRGGWQVTLSNYGVNPGAGHTASALFLMDGDLANDYLYRNAVPNHPEYNRMNTHLDMGGNNINNAGAITASGNVTTTSDVSARNVTATGETTTGGWFRTKGDTGWYSEKWGGGIYQSDANWVRVLNDKGLYTGGQVRGGTLQADGRVTVGEYLDIESTAVEGQACPKIGIQSKNNVGAPLTCQCLTPSCQSGVWKSASNASLGEKVIGGYVSYHDSSKSAEAYCPEGSVLIGLINDMTLDSYHLGKL
ncbi:shufflon system plasmid conjugative transfer pilus tip adhesin PilV [Pseudomonas putida]|uniref:Shufflon system plasmid conjugative transfer pilus tip adhesin PilV n=1 Tax=Pseudomonas putida TaxID=303 RepID=A0A4D6XER7_PSEPU|nr:shufflon system plasmid conjugative transfer pilus tip adhesin PilV [Pseudomonas putida]QCI14084.1 shufflon system plasmid conjugative transfer pilus tip adhesin PilV [Pseudomonas putida]